MKKILTLMILCIALCALLLGCGKNTIDVTEKEESSDDDIISSPLEEQIKESTVENSTLTENDEISYEYQYSEDKDINDYLNDVTSATTNIAEVDLPQDISAVGTAVIKKPLPEKTNDIQIYTKDDPVNIYELADVVSANRTALVATLAPFYDGGNIGFFSLGEAENFVNCKITWARDTGIVVPNTNYTRMYTVFKSEVGGYIIVFFDYDVTNGNNVLKSLLYVEQIYDAVQFSDIKIGDSMEKVALFDNSTSLTYSEIDNLPVYKFYYLSSGILFITYNENKTISDMQYLDYEFPNLNPNNAGDESRNYNLTILPQDYPPAS